LIGFVPFGSIVTFVFSCMDSEPYTNQYGPPPKPVPYYYLPTAGPLPPVPPPADEPELPFYQARRKAALEASGKQRYESAEPGRDSQKVEDYFAKAKEQKTAPNREPKPAFSFSTMSRRTLGIAAAGFVFVVLLVGIFLGQNSWRPTGQDPVQAVAPVTQPAPAPYTPAQATPSPPETTQPAAAAAVPAPIPTTTSHAEPQPVLPPTQATALQPGDLGLPSPLRPVGCTGQYIVVYHSSTDPTVYAQDIQTNLQSHPGSKYLLTLESCSSLNQISNAGTMIYAVYGGPFDTLTQACVAASRFPGESYVKIMDGATAPDQAVRSCQ
jgi:serine/threonine-protein kinase